MDEAASGRTAQPLDALAARIAKRRGPVRVCGLRGVAQVLVAARIIEAHAQRPALLVTESAKQNDRVLEDLRVALGEPPPARGGRVRAFPHPDTRPYDRFSPQPFVVAQRLDVLHRLATGQNEAPLVVVAPWSALALRVPARQALRKASIELVRGQRCDREALLTALADAGYTRQPVVEERGELAVRGGIVDLFPPHCARPVRLEFLGDVLESLRAFDPASQRSERELETLRAPPARELLGDRKLLIERGAAIRARGLELGVAEGAVDALLEALLRGNRPPGAEALAPFLQPATESFLDYLPPGAAILLMEPANGRARIRQLQEEANESYSALLEAKQRVISAPEALLLAPRALDTALAKRRAIALERLEAQAPARGATTHVVKSEDHEALARALHQRRSGPAPLEALLDALKVWQGDGLRVVVAAHARSDAERIGALLDEHGRLKTLRASEPAPFAAWSKPGRVEVRIAPLSAGCVLRDAGLAVISDEEILGRRGQRRRAEGWRSAAKNLALAELAPGDFLVHAEHGIGIYRGLVLLEVGDFRDEFLRIEYEASDRLFVPCHRLNLVQRYVGGDGAAPRLDKLGGASWARKLGQVKRRVRIMARELLDVHASRELSSGFAFAGRDRSLEAFEASFPYPETADQRAAIEDTLADLVKPRPMDRLVCGDVGFGKTEVAARAAHQVLMAGKQVAVLAPTTVLCQQHLETFTQRFADVPVRIEALSRFRTARDARQVLEGLASGAVDLVVGTHRLLQKAVAFRDLGLLVVDEEHRFGVTHKERIKKLKQGVDVLTLSATPIPRTLQMAFTGLRDLSAIETPPEGRHAIRTQICRNDPALIREAILREVRRGGQVFFVHNRVKTIHTLADWLRKLLPEVKLQVAHGQLLERELEARMLAFMRGEFELLLCTTIIESGLDIPRAGTILIDHADTLGLAQLHQLRGRVGRDRRRAYAYLLTPGEGAMSPDATRRLEAIQDLTELGSGFRLANLDLEIRGAGNLLGAEQSGHLADVGYDTYLELLGDAVEALRGKVRERAMDPEIRLPLPARLPEDFVPEVSQRLVLYRRLAGAVNIAEARRLRDELLDRFGPLPRETENLLGVIHLKIAARELGVASIALEQGELVLQAGVGSRIEPARLVALLKDPQDAIRVTPDQRIRARVGARGAEALFARANWLLDALASAGAAA